MPTSIVDSYRQRASDLVTLLRTDQYRYEVGLTSGRNRLSLLREQNDLFTLDSLVELGNAHNVMSASFTTERAAIKRLKNFGQWGMISLAEDVLAAEVSAEPPEGIAQHRLELRDEIARRLGFSSFFDLKTDEYGTDYKSLEGRSQTLLEQTDGMQSEDSETLKPLEPMPDLSHTYQKLFAGLGFDTSRQTNVEIDLEPESRKRRRAFCTALRVPDEIKLALNPQNHWSDVHLLLASAGRVQQFAWTSRNLPPELRLYGDRSVQDGWSSLFASLASTPAWLEETYGFAENAGIQRAATLQELIAVRRDAERLSDPESRYRAAERLRGRAFAVQMLEHLRTRFGFAWWTSRKAGDTLIDLWNTGYRYDLDELASMIGLGELSFEWLASHIDTLVRQVK